jgi:hypothetical protein
MSENQCKVIITTTPHYNGSMLRNAVACQEEELYRQAASQTYCGTTECIKAPPNHSAAPAHAVDKRVLLLCI